MIKHPFPIILALFPVFSCLVRGETQLSAEPDPRTGLEGVISVSPVHGGPSRAGVPDSRPLANITFVVNKGDETVTSFTTDEQGRFRISLAPGHYTISMMEKKPRLGRYGPFEVDIVAGQMKQVQWNCDTGMR